MQRFKWVRQAQRFLPAHGPIRAHFYPRRHRLSAAVYHEYRTQAFLAAGDVRPFGGLSLTSAKDLQALRPRPVNVTKPTDNGVAFTPNASTKWD